MSCGRLSWLIISFRTNIKSFLTSNGGHTGQQRGHSRPSEELRDTGQSHSVHTCNITPLTHETVNMMMMISNSNSISNKSPSRKCKQCQYGTLNTYDRDFHMSVITLKLKYKEIQTDNDKHE